VKNAILQLQRALACLQSKLKRHRNLAPIPRGERRGEVRIVISKSLIEMRDDYDLIARGQMPVATVLSPPKRRGPAQVVTVLRRKRIK
jgi:hypothetical protein